MAVLLAGRPSSAAPVDTPVNLPDSPTPTTQTSSDSTPAAAPAQSDPKSTANQDSSATEEERRKQAQEQLDSQLHQRVFAVMATFNTTANRDALPLSAGQKYELFFKSATDPWPFVLNAAGAGIDQAENSFPEYGQGVEGYSKRFGAAYTDYFTGNLFGNAVLASLFKEDPRYFQKGTGSFGSRLLWAASGTVWCRRDNLTWGPNYANVLGNLVGAAISNFYYPEPERTVGQTFERGFTVTGQAIIGSEIIEFWPDMVRYHRRKQAEKLARKMGQPLDQSSSQSSSPAQPDSPGPQQ